MFRRQEAQAAGPVLLGRGTPPRVEVINKAIEKVFGGGIQRIRLGLHRLVGDGLRPSDFIHPHNDGPGRFDGHNPDNDDDEQEHPNSQPNGDHPKVAIGVDGFAPYFGVLGPGVFGLGLGSLI